MDPVTILRGIATLLVNPALGGGGIGVIRGAALLEQFATLVEGGYETHKALQEFAKDIELLVAQNGNPSRGQWEAMVARDQAARAALEANRQALGADAPPPPPQASAPELPLPPADSVSGGLGADALPLLNESDGTGSAPPATGNSGDAPPPDDSTDATPPRTKSKSKSGK